MYLSYVLPLKVVVTQALLLLLAIAIEAIAFQRQLEFTPRKSMEYSTSINLLSTTFGWFSFFVLTETFPMPLPAEIQLLNFIFFDRWTQDVLTWTVALGFVGFFGTVFTEFIGFTLLQWLLNERKPLEEETPKKARRLSWTVARSRLNTPGVSDQTEPLYVILVGNAFSYAVIVLLLVLIRLTSVIQDTPLG